MRKQNRRKELAAPNWTTEFPGSITVCDLRGIVLEMNEKAAAMYTRHGGTELIGKNLFDCHPEPARSKLQQLLDTGKSNVYTIEKNRTKKLIYQAPWFQDGQRRGMVELAFEVPFDPSHFIRE
jgi:transcriptional regulator with PAS, ATPase and Fis domain